MKIARRLEDVERDRPAVVTVGSFDGVHLAHRKILREVVDRARRSGGRSVLVTFDRHPRELLRPQTPFWYLSTPEERQELCASFGLDLMLELEFTKTFSELSPEEFLQRYVVDGLRATEMVEGFNHHFGHNREGSAEALRRMGERHGFATTTLEQVTIDGTGVSSTVIRDQLLRGDVRTAAAFLGRPYNVTGMVVEGDRRGRTLGYPTANIVPGFAHKLVPANGIYVAKARFVGGGGRYCLVSIGTRPTFHDGGVRMVEAHLLDYHNDLYGQELRIELLDRLRDEEKFASADELIRQMDADRARAVSLIATYERN